MAGCRPTIQLHVPPTPGALPVAPLGLGKLANLQHRLSVHRATDRLARASFVVSTLSRPIEQAAARGVAPESGNPGRFTLPTGYQGASGSSPTPNSAAMAGALAALEPGAGIFGARDGNDSNPDADRRPAERDFAAALGGRAIGRERAQTARFQDWAKDSAALPGSMNPAKLKRIPKESAGCPESRARHAATPHLLAMASRAGLAAFEDVRIR